MSTKRRSVEDELFWRNEKEPAHRWPVTPRVRVPVNENLIGSSVMSCCGEYRCVCVCPDCGESSVTGMRCSLCCEVRERQLDRDRAETATMSDMLVAQLRWAGL